MMRSTATTPLRIDVDLALRMLRLIAVAERIDRNELQAALEISRAGMFRLLAQVQVLGVRIESEGKMLRVGAWGGLRKRWVMERSDPTRT